MLPNRIYVSFKLTYIIIKTVRLFLLLLNLLKLKNFYIKRADFFSQLFLNLYLRIQFAKAIRIIPELNKHF